MPNAIIKPILTLLVLTMEGTFHPGFPLIAGPELLCKLFARKFALTRPVHVNQAPSTSHGFSGWLFSNQELKSSRKDALMQHVTHCKNQSPPHAADIVVLSSCCVQIPMPLVKPSDFTKSY